jgi:hypothetical protein
VSDPGRHLSPEQRIAFRAFVRDHHPDRGGDPDAFTAGMDRFRVGAVADAVSTDVGPPASPHDSMASPHDPMPFPVRLGVALIRTWRRRHDPS